MGDHPVIKQLAGLLAAAVLIPHSAHASEPARHRAVVVLLDASGSLKKTDPDDLRTESARLFIDAAPDGDKVHLLTFDGGVTPITSGFVEVNAGSRAALVETLQHVRRDGQFTDHVAALDAAAASFERQSSDFLRQYQPTVVIFTDGILDPDPRIGTADARVAVLPKVLLRLREAGASVYSIVLGESSAPLLRKAGDETNGRTFGATQPAELLRAFWQLRERFSNAFEIARKRQVTEATSFVVPGWATSLTVAVTRASRATGQRATAATPSCDASLFPAGQASCATSRGRDYVLFRCERAQTKELTVRIGRCAADVAVAATGDVHLDLGLRPEQPVAGEPTTVSVAVKAGTSLLTNLPFLEDAVGAVKWNTDDLPLYDDGAGGDAKAGDGVFTRTWRPTQAGSGNLIGHMGGSSFDLHVQQTALRVIAAPLSVASPNAEISCLLPSGCTERVVVTSQVPQTLKISSRGGAKFTPLLLAPRSTGELELTYEPPIQGAQAIATTLAIEGFEHSVTREILVRRLTLIQFLWKYWFLSLPAGVLLGLLAFLMLRPASPLSGTIIMNSEAADGSSTARPVNLAHRRARRLRAADLGLQSPFFLESRKRGLFGSAMVVVPNGSALRVERRVRSAATATSLSVTSFRKLESGDTLILTERDQTFRLTYRN